MTEWTASPPSGWREACADGNAFFYTEDWTALLERSFACSSLYFLDDDGGKGAVMTRFQAGPFSVGYLGFPFGGIPGGGQLSGAFLEELRKSGGERLPVALRIPVSAFGPVEDLDLPCVATAETSIVDLQSWALEKINKNRRRDVNRSLRAGLDLVDASDPADGKHLYELYRKTLERNDGSLRYTADYFRELILMSQKSPRLRVLLAKKEQAIAAFTVVALHDRVACYLHGAFDWAMRDYLPSAMLLYEAIEWSKAQGCESFNLMSSPVGQDSLVRYKERWGAETREMRTYTLPLRPAYPLFRMAERLYRLIQ